MHPGRRMESVAIRRKAAVPKPDYAIQQRAIMPKTHLVNIKGIYKYQCQICEHSFVKRDNFTVSLKFCIFFAFVFQFSSLALF